MPPSLLVAECARYFPVDMPVQAIILPATQGTVRLATCAPGTTTLLFHCSFPSPLESQPVAKVVREYTPSMMVLSRILSELVQVVSPWRHAPLLSLLVNQGGLELAGVGSSRTDVHYHEETFGPLWFAVPKKRVPLGKKRTRTADRTPKRITHYTLCSKCGQPKMNHKFCNNIELCASGSSAQNQR